MTIGVYQSLAAGSAGPAQKFGAQQSAVGKSGQHGLFMQTNDKAGFANALQQWLGQLGDPNAEADTTLIGFTMLTDELKGMIAQLLLQLSEAEQAAPEMIDDMFEIFEETLSAMLADVLKTSIKEGSSELQTAGKEWMLTSAIPLVDSNEAWQGQAAQGLSVSMIQALKDVKQSFHAMLQNSIKLDSSPSQLKLIVQQLEQLGHDLQLMKHGVQQMLLSHSPEKGMTELLSMLQGISRSAEQGNHAQLQNVSLPVKSEGTTAITLQQLHANLAGNAGQSQPHFASQNVEGEIEKNWSQLVQRIQSMLDDSMAETGKSNSSNDTSQSAAKNAANPAMLQTTLDAMTRGTDMSESNAKTEGSPRMSLQNFSEEFAKLVIRRFDTIQLNGFSQARIQLVPEHLGQLDIQLKMQNGQLTATIVTERLIGREMIESQLSVLRSSLTSQGIQLDKIEVSSQADGKSLMQDQQQQQSQSSKSFQQQKESGYDAFSSFELALEEEEDAHSGMRRAWQGGSFDATA